jgi:methyl-accepting chemotaxis protein
MDKETKEYLDKILIGLTSREDVEKLRQETKSNFRQLKEENSKQILEWRQEVKADIGKLAKEGKVEIDPIRKELRDGIQELKVGNQSTFDQSIQKVEHLFQKIKEEIETHLAHSREVTGTDTGGLKEVMESLKDGIHQLTEEMTSVKEKMKEGFGEVKEELGSMIKFSYADLEKKFNALEARIKALEKMVFP